MSSFASPVAGQECGLPESMRPYGLQGIPAEIERQEMALVVKLLGGDGLEQVAAEVHHLQLHQVTQPRLRYVPDIEQTDFTTSRINL